MFSSSPRRQALFQSFQLKGENKKDPQTASVDLNSQWLSLSNCNRELIMLYSPSSRFELSRHRSKTTWYCAMPVFFSTCGLPHLKATLFILVCLVNRDRIRIASNNELKIVSLNLMPKLKTVVMERTIRSCVKKSWETNRVQFTVLEPAAYLNFALHIHTFSTRTVLRQACCG